VREPRVVVGVDGSVAGGTAVRWAAGEAAARDATLRIVHAFVWPVYRVPVGPSEVAPGLRAAAELTVRDAVELAGKTAPGVRVESAIVTGFPFPVLAGESREADLTVVGSRGLGATLSVLVGSTAVDLVAHAQGPVVVVRPDELGETGHRVVVGYDGSAASRGAYRFALDYADLHGLGVLVATVHDDAATKPADTVTAPPPVPGHEHVQVSSTLLSGHPAEELVRLSQDARLLVVGSRGRGGFTGMLLGSVSQAVLHHAQCPVAVLPAAGAGSLVTRD
jgi:nucleotide-binding universal stress UspA family protein